jgi:hypothetical protein
LAIVLLSANVIGNNNVCRFDNKMEKEKRKKIKEEFLNQLLGRKYK